MRFLSISRSTLMDSHRSIKVRAKPWHGWLGLGLVAIFWPLSWSWPGPNPRAPVPFFPLWTGLILVLDALVWRRRGTSLLTRDLRAFAGLFLTSAPTWWLFEFINRHVRNWRYLGVDHSLFSDLMGTLAFSTVIPAVFEAAELVATCPFMGRFRHGPRLRPTSRVLAIAFSAGWSMLIALLLWPRYCFPFLWLSLLLILEPINHRLGHSSLLSSTAEGDWQPVLALSLGVLLCAFFWEFWNYWSFPKWIYTIPYGDFLHIFEMPILGYGGYPPFGLELYAFYHLFAGKGNNYIQIDP